MKQVKPAKYNDWSGPLKGLDEYEAEIREMAKKKFGLDHDGECPVELKVIDRTKFEPDAYLPIAYAYNVETLEDLDEIRQSLNLNLSLAAQAMDRFVRREKARIERILEKGPRAKPD